MRRGVGRARLIALSVALFFLVVLAAVVLTARSFHTKPWDREILHRAILTELNLHPDQVIWNPAGVDLDEYRDSVSTIYLREAIGRATAADWLRKYHIYFRGRKRIRRELGGPNDPIALEARRLGYHDDSLRLSGEGGSWVVSKLPLGVPLGTVARLSVFYDLHHGDVWRRTFTGKAGRRVYRLDYYPHLLLEDMRGGWFPGDHIQDFP